MPPHRVAAVPTALHRAAGSVTGTAEALAALADHPDPAVDLPGAQIGAVVSAAAPREPLRDCAARLADWADEVHAAAEALRGADDRAAGGL